MFTGLIQKVGKLSRLDARGDGARIRIEHDAWDEPLSLGESVAVQGVCLTVTECVRTSFTCDAVATTLAQTTLHSMRPGVPLNLERALRPGDRFGGHIVTGHVDGTGSVLRVTTAALGKVIEIGCPPELMAEIAPRGSIACDGASLTVAAVAGSRITINLIPFTLEHTSMRDVRVNDRLNIETDVLAKYARRCLERSSGGQAISVAKLRDAGFEV